MNGPDVFFEAVRSWAQAGTGHPVFVMYATGAPTLPYTVIEPRWLSEPDVGGVWADQPAAQSISFHANSYGRRTTDALWLDERLYHLFVDEPLPALGVDILFREGDSAPVLTFTDAGLMLSKHRYGMTYR